MQRAEEIPLGPFSQSGNSLKQAGEQLGQGWLWRAAGAAQQQELLSGTPLWGA